MLSKLLFPRCHFVVSPQSLCLFPHPFTFLSMPLQNRVNPYGEICFTKDRGTLMGNRGQLHSDRQEIVRDHRLKAWIICLLDFKGRHREVMQPGLYTELFFLDEATALAAGHRPCAQCQYQRFQSFKALWKKANQLPDIDLSQLDDVLHRERISKTPVMQLPGELPDGVLVEYENKPYLMYAGKIWEWSFAGYFTASIIPIAKPVKVITPPSTVRAIAAGFSPGMHHSALEPLKKDSSQ